MYMHYYFHSQPFNGVRVTIAGKYEPEAKILKIAAARCSKKDVFNKKIGRKIASGRLEANILAYIDEIDDFSIKKFIKIANMISKTVSLTSKIQY